MSQAGLGKPACQYSGAEFRQRAKGLAQRLGEPVERLAALCEALATTNASRSQKPKLPARLLRDASADGGLEAALKALDANQRKNVNEEALQTVEKAWLQAGLTQEKRVCFDKTVDARNRRELTTIAKAMSCSIVDDATQATHVVFFNPAVDAIVDESEYLRTLVVDDARHLALVHWWYRPDSSDEWIPLERVEGAPPPLKDVDAWARPSLTHNGEPWRVCCRFLRDAKAHNEFGDERDYVEEEEVRLSASYLHESSPGMMDVGGLFSDFEPFRGVLERPRSRRWRRAPRRRRGRGDGVVPRPPRRRRHGHASVHASSTRRRRRDHESRSTTQEDEPEPIKPEPKKSRKRKKREDQPPPRRKFRVKVLEAERPAQTSNARVDVTTAGLRVGADRPRDVPAAPVSTTAPAPAPPPVVLDEEAFRSSTRLDRAACPEWFCGDSSKTPAAFLAAKAWMVSLSKRSAPDQFLTATICRQRLSVDAAAALRLWSYLDAIGAVNAAVPPERRRRPRQPSPVEPPPSSDKEDVWTPGRLKALVASASVGSDWQTCASDVSQSEGGVVTPIQCCAKFVDLDPAHVKDIVKSEPVIQKPSVPVVIDDGKAALDALVAARLDRLEDRVARLSDLERQLADDQAAQTVERARLAAEWAGVALNLEP